MQEQTLAIAISKSGIGLAVFQGQHLISLEGHPFHAMPKPAEVSAGHTIRSIETFNIGTAVIQQSPDHPPDIREAVVHALQSCNRPIFELSEAAVLSSFGNPPLKNKKELRELARILFPQIPAGPLLLACLDAVTLGLHFETKHLLSLN